MGGPTGATGSQRRAGQSLGSLVVPSYQPDLASGPASPRRAAQLKDCNPQVQVLPVRGNVETRLDKSQSDEYDGVILAAAGLVRLGLAERVSEYLSLEEFVPPPGQGVLAVEMRVDDDRMREMLTRVDDLASRSAATAERGFLELLGGGCQLPVGAYAQAEGKALQLRVFMSTPRGRQCVPRPVVRAHLTLRTSWQVRLTRHWWGREQRAGGSAAGRRGLGHFSVGCLVSCNRS